MMFRFRFLQPAAAVKHACHDCEAQRAWFRSRGLSRWDRYQALCFRCYGRHLKGHRAGLATTGITGALAPRQDNRSAVA